MPPIEARMSRGLADRFDSPLGNMGGTESWREKCWWQVKTLNTVFRSHTVERAALDDGV